MSLSKHVDADELIAKAAVSDHLSLVQRANGSRKHLSSAHAGRYATDPIPKYTMPKTGISNDAAYQLITDELSLDGKPTLNLASFVHTWMPQQATQLNTENCMINLCDQDEYPATMAIHGRCVSMLADLWNAPKETDKNGKKVEAMGVATTGSSEAIMLGGLAMKRRWQEKRKAEGKDWSKPNVVFGSNAQVAIEKFARYFECEERLVPVSKESHYRLDPRKAINMVDENTIGVIVILGSTYTGHYEPVKEMSDLLDEYEKKTGQDVPIHVDGASGAMVAPFAHPSLQWDFKLPRVKSINTSGHKFGMVYPGLGWVLFRSQDMVPKDLIFELHYLGSTEYSFGLNFSRPASPVLMFYFNMISLGFQGFRDVMWGDLKNARLLSRALELSGYYDVLSDIHKPASALAKAGAKAGVLDDDNPENYEAGLPVVAFKWTDEFKANHPHLEQRWMQTLLRAKGWIIPNYGLSPDCEEIDVLRIVVRENLSEDMIDQVVHDIMSITESLVDQNSSEAHLAQAMSQKASISKGQNEVGVGAMSTADEGMKFPKQGTRLSKHHHNLEAGSGTKAKGYSKQC